jgi:hypothetical protein
MNLTTQQGNSSSILGLAAYPKTDAACVSAAFNKGINYFFFYNLNCESFLDGVTSSPTNSKNIVGPRPLSEVASERVSGSASHHH